MIQIYYKETSAEKHYTLVWRKMKKTRGIILNGIGVQIWDGKYVKIKHYTPDLLRLESVHHFPVGDPTLGDVRKDVPDNVRKCAEFFEKAGLALASNIKIGDSISRDYFEYV